MYTIPAKITNPLRQGLPAKIYLLSLGTLTTRYKIAKIVYGVVKGVPPVGRISVTVRKMIEDGYLAEVEDKITARIAPLVDELERELERYNVILTKEERNYIGRIMEVSVTHWSLFRILSGHDGEIPISGDGYGEIMAGISQEIWGLMERGKPRVLRIHKINENFNKRQRMEGHYLNAHNTRNNLFAQIPDALVEKLKMLSPKYRDKMLKEEIQKKLEEWVEY